LSPPCIGFLRSPHVANTPPVHGPRGSHSARIRFFVQRRGPFTFPQCGDPSQPPGPLLSHLGCKLLEYSFFSPTVVMSMTPIHFYCCPKPLMEPGEKVRSRFILVKVAFFPSCFLFGIRQFPSVISPPIFLLAPFPPVHLWSGAGEVNSLFFQPSRPRPMLLPPQQFVPFFFLGWMFYPPLLTFQQVPQIGSFDQHFFWEFTYFFFLVILVLPCCHH